MKTKLRLSAHVLLIYSLLFSWPTAAHSAPPGLANQLPDLVENVIDGVVNISSTRFVKQWVLRGMPEFFGMFGIPEEHVSKQSSLGSGFLIDGDGYIITNNHVIEGADEVVITFRDNRRVPAKIVGRDKLMDLALLQLRGGKNNKNLKPVKLGNSDSVRIAEYVFAIGNPFGLGHTVTDGIISQKNRSIGIGVLDNFLQTNASINFGNSGGPLFNFKGEVIGINTAINGQGQLLGFAIPIDEARSKLEDLKKYGYIIRAWLGILGINITPAIQYNYDLPVDHGVAITDLVRSGPAADVGLKPGDIIVTLADKEIAARGDIQKILSKFKPGEKVAIGIRRGGKKLTYTVKLEVSPDTSKLPQEVL